jgi:D-sedoheptulose 7-phosphate isomerase
VAFLGKDGGRLAGVADYEWIVHSFPYSDRIQEAHMAAMHLIIEGLEHLLFHQQETIPSKIQISQYTVYGAP